ncbi:hypothetical protein NL676_011528 [Syzygium grande]|nr:hypothetical protein NL676_011528 [Syzygium grande]
MKGTESKKQTNKGEAKRDQQIDQKVKPRSGGANKSMNFFLTFEIPKSVYKKRIAIRLQSPTRYSKMEDEFHPSTGKLDIVSAGHTLRSRWLAQLRVAHQPSSLPRLGLARRGAGSSKNATGSGGISRTDHRSSRCWLQQAHVSDSTGHAKHAPRAYLRSSQRCATIRDLESWGLEAVGALQVTITSGFGLFSELYVGLCHRLGLIVPISRVGWGSLWSGSRLEN